MVSNGGRDIVLLELLNLRCVKKKENSFEDTIQTAKKQIEQINYAAGLTLKRIPLERIRTYRFAFKRKNVLIG